MATIPFKKPLIYNAVRTAGFVDIPDSIAGRHTVDESVLKVCASTNGGGKNGDDNDTGGGDSSGIPGPLALQRKQTMSGNIMVIEPTIVHVDDNDNEKINVTNNDDNNNSDLPSAYWLQRKLGNKATTHGSVVRLAYKLRFKYNSSSSRKTSSSGDSSALDTSTSSSSSSSPYSDWELDVDMEGKPIMVMIHILHSQILDGTAELGNANPLDELSALQLIYAHNPTETAHVTRTPLVSMCHRSIYSVLPYYHDGTLLQFCQSVGATSASTATTTTTEDSPSTTSTPASDTPLPEPLARFLFRQIIQGLKTLQETGLCHRNLSLDSALLNGDQLDICDLGWAMLYDDKAAVDDDQSFPPPGGSDPQFIPPEYFHTTKGHWDGFRGDLWSAGLMLYSMVVGKQGLFTAPIAEDKSFARLCVKGDIRGQLKRYGKLAGRDFSGVSDDLVDLLQKMLRADPKQRLSLEEVLHHPWLTNEDVVSPTAWMEAHK